MVSVCLLSDALSQHLPSYLGFSYLGRGLSLHGCSSKAQSLLLTLDEGYLLTAAPPDLECGVAPLAPPLPAQPLPGRGYLFTAAPAKCRHCSLWASQIAQLVKNLPAMQEIPGLGRSTGEGIGYPLQYSWASLVAQLVKNLPAMQETRVRSLGLEDALEKGNATHSSVLAWRIPWTV